MPKSDLTAFFARIFVSQPGHIVIFEKVNWLLSQINQVKIHGTWLFRPILSVKWILIYPSAKKANTLTKNPIFLIGDFYMALLTYKNSCKKSCKVTFGDKESQIICLYHSWDFKIAYCESHPPPRSDPCYSCSYQ